MVHTQGGAPLRQASRQQLRHGGAWATLCSMGQANPQRMNSVWFPFTAFAEQSESQAGNTKAAARGGRTGVVEHECPGGGRSQGCPTV